MDVTEICLGYTKHKLYINVYQVLDLKDLLDPDQRSLPLPFPPSSLHCRQCRNQ